MANRNKYWLILVMAWIAYIGWEVYVQIWAAKTTGRRWGGYSSGLVPVYTSFIGHNSHLYL